MTIYLLDTNALLSFLTTRNLAQQAIIAPFFQQAETLACRLWIHPQTIAESVYVLQKIYQLEPAVIRDTLRTLLQSPGIELVMGAKIAPLWDLWPDRTKDFGDALQLACVLNHPGVSMLTFDHGLQNLLLEFGVPCPLRSSP